MASPRRRGRRPSPCRSIGRGSRRLPARPPPVLSERGEIDVVLEPHGKLEELSEVVAESVALRGPRRSSRGRCVGARRRRRRARRPRRRSRRAVETRRRDESRPQVGDLLEHARGVGAVDLHVEPRPDVPAEVADRRAGSGRPRRGRGRASFPGPARRTRRRTRARRPRSSPRGRARPRAVTGARATRSAWRCRPGARSRRARSVRPSGSLSSTVRLFKCLSSGGSAGAETRELEIISDGIPTKRSGLPMRLDAKSHRV